MKVLWSQDSPFLWVSKVFTLIRIKILRVSRLFLVFLVQGKNKLITNGEKSILVATHLGLGDQLLALPLYFELVKGKEFLNVVTSKEAKPILEIFTEKLPIIYHVIDRPMTVQDKSFFWRLNKYSRDNNFRLVYLGWENLKVFKFLYPQLSEVEIIYHLAGVNIQKLKNFNASYIQEDLLSDQLETPKIRYALIDTFPGTLREIPESVLEEISSRDLKVIRNPREVPFERLIQLVLNATELHFVNSSMLCFSLLLKPEALSKNIYLMKEGLYHGYNLYDLSWHEWILEPGKSGLPVSVKQVNRQLLYERQTRISNRPSRVLLRSLLKFISGSEPAPKFAKGE